MSTEQLVLLPATDPQDVRFGEMPTTLGADRRVALHHVRFPQLVWYTEAVRQQANAQIDELGLDRFVLVGFSKSALGAWHLAMALRERVAATILFDSPVTTTERPSYVDTTAYPTDAAWCADLPITSLDRYVQVMPAAHRLVLISGDLFHEEMQSLSAQLDARRCRHTFLPRPTLPHRWDSGWLDEAWDHLAD